MNLVLFDADEIGAPLLRQDPRAIHILEVLRRTEGDSFDVGLVNGPRGKATLSKIASSTLELHFTWGLPPPPLPPLTLLIGLPRPQTARKILQEATALGVGALHFITAERGEFSYASSTLWSSGEWRRHLLAGAAQAFCTRLPTISHGQTLEAALQILPTGSRRIAMDNYEASLDLAASLHSLAQKPPLEIAIAIGSERGWTASERTLLRANQFTLAHLGPRVLRTETAVVATISIVRSALGWF